MHVKISARLNPFTKPTSLPAPFIYTSIIVHLVSSPIIHKIQRILK